MGFQADSELIKALLELKVQEEAARSQQQDPETEALIAQLLKEDEERLAARKNQELEEFTCKICYSGLDEVDDSQEVN